MGFGVAAPSADDTEYGEHREITAEGAAEMLVAASRVVITPGYGMAGRAGAVPGGRPGPPAPRARRGRAVGIQPVAGRLPGHMNVLLAEAKVPYDIVLSMDEINDDLASTSVVLVIGANDTVNPAGRGRPVEPHRRDAGAEGVGGRERHRVQAHRWPPATRGVQNPLFFRDNAQMLFGDAKQRVEDIIAAL